MAHIPFKAKDSIVAFLLITGVTLLIYSNTFYSAFQFDDDINIVQNSALRDLSNFWPPSGRRYVGELSFALNYQFDKLDVFGYHLVNTTIHVLNGFLVWWLVFLTLKTPRMAGAGGLTRHPELMALTAALLFVAHPIQTQAVTYIVQRFTSLATLFYLLSLVMYIQARLSNPNRETPHPRPVSSILCYGAALLSAVLAMETKEIAFTLPLVLVLYEFTFLGDPGRTSRSVDLKRFIGLIPFLGTWVIIPFNMLREAGPAGESIGDLREAARETEAISGGEYFLTQFRVLVTYVRLLFLPVNQNLDYDYPVFQSFVLPVFFSFLFLLMIFGAAVYLFYLSRQERRRGLRLPAFGIFWFFITLSVESSVIPIRDVIYEHRLYLPSVGVALAFVAGAFFLFEYARPKGSPFQAACLLILVTVIPLGIATYNRNGVWTNAELLWEDVVKKSPYKGRGYAELGNVYAKQGRLDEAYQNFTMALKLAPNYVYARLNLGTFYLTRGRLKEAEGEYMTALKLGPSIAQVHYNLGVLYQQEGRSEEASNAYKETLKLAPLYIKAHVNLGVLYAMQGNMEDAAEKFMSALKLSPDDPRIHYNLGKVRRAQGRNEEARRYFEMAVKLKPDYTEAHQALQSR